MRVGWAYMIIVPFKELKRWLATLQTWELNLREKVGCFIIISRTFSMKQGHNSTVLFSWLVSLCLRWCEIFRIIFCWKKRQLRHRIASTAPKSVMDERNCFKVSDITFYCLSNANGPKKNRKEKVDWCSRRKVLKVYGWIESSKCSLCIES